MDNRPKAILCTISSPFLGCLDYFLKRNNNFKIIIPENLISQRLKSICQTTNSEIINLESIFDKNDQYNFSNILTKLENELKNYLTSNNFSDKYLNSNIAYCVSETANSYIRRTILPFTLALEKIHSQFNLKLFLLSEDITCSGKTFSSWANLRSIPSLHLLHGASLWKPTTIHDHLTSDVVCFYGEEMEKSYINSPRQSSKFVITGSPAWDTYFELRKDRANIRLKLCQQHGIDPNTFLLVFAPTWAAGQTAIEDENIYSNTLSIFIHAVKQLYRAGKLFTAVIKDRKAMESYGKSRVEELCNEIGIPPSAIIYIADPPENWVVSADTLVSFESSISVDAMMCGTPAINIMLDAGLRMGPGFTPDSGVLDVMPENLPLVIQYLIETPSLRAELSCQLLDASPRYNVGANDGRSGERVAQLMEKIIANPENFLPRK